MQSSYRVGRASLRDEYVAGGLNLHLGSYLRVLPQWIDPLTRDFGEDLYERMMLDDAVGSSVHALIMMILAEDINLRPAIEDKADPDYEEAKECCDFIEYNFDELSRHRPMKELLEEMCQAVAVGNKVAEQVYHVVESGRWTGWQSLLRLKTKPRRSTAFVVDALENCIGMRAIIPGKSLTVGMGSTVIDPALLTNVIARQKFAVLTWRMRNGDPRGTSLLQGTYKSWWEKQQILIEYMKCLAQFGSPSVVGTVGENATPEYPADGNGNPIPGAAPISPVQSLFQALLNFKNGTALALPFGADAKLLMPPGEAGSAFRQAIDYWNRAITKSVLLTIRATMESEFGSKADSETAQDVTGNLVKYGRSWVAGMLTNDIAFPLLMYNKGAEKAKKFLPKIQLSPVEHQDWAEVAGAASQLVTSGLVTEPMKAELCEKIGLPEYQEAPQPAPGMMPPGGPGGGGAPGQPPPSSPDVPPGGGAGGAMPDPLDVLKDAGFSLWQESAHQRGQPDNPGQFGAGGGGGAAATSGAQAKKKAARTAPGGASPAPTPASASLPHPIMQFAQTGARLAAVGYGVARDRLAPILAAVPEPIRAPLGNALHATHALLMMGNNSIQATAQAAAARSGLSPDATAKLARTLTCIDLSFQGSAMATGTLSAATGNLGLAGVAKLASYVPIASLGYVLYHPLSSLRAAFSLLRERFPDKIGEATEFLTHAVRHPLTQHKPATAAPATATATAAFANPLDSWADLLASRLANAPHADGWLAAFSVAFDETRNVEEAVRMADACGVPPSADASVVTAGTAAFADYTAGWKTLEGGTHVFLDADGYITKGPSDMHGLKPSELKKKVTHHHGSTPPTPEAVKQPQTYDHAEPVAPVAAPAAVAAPAPAPPVVPTKPSAPVPPSGSHPTEGKTPAEAKSELSRWPAMHQKTSTGKVDHDPWKLGDAKPSAGVLNTVIDAIGVAQKKNSFARPIMADLYDTAKKAHPDLSLGEFQGAMAKLGQDRKIVLAPWTSNVHSMPDRDATAAFPLDGDIKNYADGLDLSKYPADVAFAEDAAGHEHRDKGEGGGRFVSKGEGGGSGGNGAADEGDEDLTPAPTDPSSPDVPTADDYTTINPDDIDAPTDEERAAAQQEHEEWEQRRDAREGRSAALTAFDDKHTDATISAIRQLDDSYTSLISPDAPPLADLRQTAEEHLTSLLTFHEGVAARLADIGATDDEQANYRKAVEKHTPKLREKFDKMFARAEKARSNHALLTEAQASPPVRPEDPPEPEDVDEPAAGDYPPEPTTPEPEEPDEPDWHQYGEDEFQAVYDTYTKEHDAWEKEHEPWEKEHSAWEAACEKIDDEYNTAHEKWEADHEKWDEKVDKIDEAHERKVEAHETKVGRLDDAYGKAAGKYDEAAEAFDDAVTEMDDDTYTVLKEIMDAHGEEIDDEEKDDAEPTAEFAAGGRRRPDAVAVGAGAG